MKKFILSAAMILALFAAGCSSEGYVAKVENRKITEAEFKFYLDTVKENMADTELQTEEDWQTTEIEGKKAIDIAKERALETAINNIAYISIGEKLDVELSDAEKASISRTKASLVSQYGGNSTYNEFLQSYGLKDDFIDMLCESMVYSEKLTERIEAEQPVTDGDIEQYFAENQESLSAGLMKAKHVLRVTKDTVTQEPYSEEQVAEQKALAEDLLQQAQNGADFDTLVQEYSEDPGSATNPDGYVFRDGDMVAEFQDCVESLQPGEIGFAQSDFGFHVIQRLPIGLEDVGKDQVKEALLTERLNERVETWKTELGIQIETNEEALSQIN